jgi:hypothetical protein
MFSVYRLCFRSPLAVDAVAASRAPGVCSLRVQRILHTLSLALLVAAHPPSASVLAATAVQREIDSLAVVGRVCVRQTYKSQSSAETVGCAGLLIETAGKLQLWAVAAVFPSVVIGESMGK